MAVAVGENVGVAVHVGIGVGLRSTVVAVTALVGWGVAVGTTDGAIASGDDMRIARCPTSMSCTLSDVAPTYTIMRIITAARPMAT